MVIKQSEGTLNELALLDRLLHHLVAFSGYLLYGVADVPHAVYVLLPLGRHCHLHLLQGLG